MTSAPQRKLPIDPAWIALALAALVLIAVSAWLSQSRRVPEARVEAEPAVAARPAAPAPNPLETQLAEITSRLAASEAALAELRARPAGDPAALAALGQRIDQGSAAAEARLKALEDGLAQRIGEGTAAVGRRLDAMEQAASQRAAADQGVGRRMEALERSLAERTAGELALTRRIEAVDQGAAQRAAQAEQSVGQRLSAIEQSAAQRAAQAEQTVTQRLAAIEQSANQRAAQAEQAATQRIAALEQSTAERVAPLQDALRRLGATEARTERLGSIAALRTQLDAGQPLGAALQRLGGTPPEALARYASAAPPTEASLRLSFEEAIRQARTATTGQDSLTARLNSLLTVRRGDEVLWGDTSEVQIERARRALEAGDVEGALAALGRLPEANRAALRGWTAEAEALVAARAALRSLAAG